MSDQIALQVGAAPWNPSDDAVIVDEYDRYDMPTAGVIEQGGVPYLFECVEGVAERFNVWVYAPLSASEATAISVLEDPHLTSAMQHVFESRNVAVALAVDDRIHTGGVLYDSDAVRSGGIRRAAAGCLVEVLNEETSATDALRHVFA